MDRRPDVVDTDPTKPLEQCSGWRAVTAPLVERASRSRWTRRQPRGWSFRARTCPASNSPCTWCRCRRTSSPARPASGPPPHPVRRPGQGWPARLPRLRLLTGLRARAEVCPGVECAQPLRPTGCSGGPCGRPGLSPDPRGGSRDGFCSVSGSAGPWRRQAVRPGGGRGRWRAWPARMMPQSSPGVLVGGVEGGPIAGRLQSLGDAVEGFAVLDRDRDAVRGLVSTVVVVGAAWSWACVGGLSGGFVGQGRGGGRGRQPQAVAGLAAVSASEGRRLAVQAGE